MPFSDLFDFCRSYLRKPAAGELAAGVPKPSTVLVEMICVDLLALKTEPSRPKSPSHPSRRVSEVHTDWYHLRCSTQVLGYSFDDARTLSLLEPSITLSKHEKALLTAAWDKAETLREQKNAAEKEALKQGAALRAIEVRLGLTNVEPKENLTTPKGPAHVSH